MTDFNQVMSVSGIVGLLLPMLVDFINLHVVNSKAKYFIGLLSSIVAAFAITLFQNQFNTAEVLTSLGIVFTLSQTLFKTYWGSANLRAKFAGVVAPKSKLASAKKKQ